MIAQERLEEVQLFPALQVPVHGKLLQDQQGREQIEAPHHLAVLQAIFLLAVLHVENHSKEFNNQIIAQEILRELQDRRVLLEVVPGNRENRHDQVLRHPVTLLRLRGRVRLPAHLRQVMMVDNGAVVPVDRDDNKIMK